ncbi:MAG TPA: type II toxin-antitoxin system Phd/YefM family antitoxin [Candidatus Thiothrix moscowensis]|uniref:type II toxin-antitoxin system Phd/YefM family antitoxin n=1 Tax=unclassified Thiothrix TaxID=2636184 RepID=UPI0025CC5A7F|nr:MULTISPECIES: type II toxin-antitoxin system Phd/YefM family antitoxin [unclassified Thiothrix]HRJ51564.1 type II toxin-antitoxin system Phd/YefM family antitoxin [Candidatus Thiothrix moscowensis]HRJ91879.1 type II toxin-antitoxin system Phd/YefM family antitoxin [Candidatus Thiothrix moscowensis]
MELTTIAYAKNNLPRLIHAAEAGDDIHITRHGRPVAVLISEERYQQLFSTGKSVFQAILQWREQYGGIDLSDEEVDSWRDRTPAREFAWD